MSDEQHGRPLPLAYRVEQLFLKAIEFLNSKDTRRFGREERYVLFSRIAGAKWLLHRAREDESPLAQKAYESMISKVDQCFGKMGLDKRMMFEEFAPEYSRMNDSRQRLQ